MNPGGSDITITVGGDISPLETALAAVPEAFSGITSQIDDAFAGLVTVTSDLENLAAAAGTAISPVQELGEQLGLFNSEAMQFGTSFEALPEIGSQLQLFTQYTGDAKDSLQVLDEEAQQSPGLFQQVGSSITELAAKFFLLQQAYTILKSAIEDVVQQYAEEQKAILALGSLLGDQSAAQAAIDSAKNLANQLGLAQEAAFSAQQKLIALGESLANIPRDLTAIADGAAAMNTSFDTAAQRFDMIINSGQLMARSLTSIGLSMNDVANAMGLAGIPASVLTKAFKDLDESQRAAVLSSAELSKNAGAAAAAASGATGAWNIFKNALGDAEQDIGKAAGGFVGLAEAASTAVSVISKALVGLMVPINEVANAIAVAVNVMIDRFKELGSVVSDAATGSFSKIPADIKTSEDKITADSKLFLDNAKSDWTGAWSTIAGATSTATKGISDSVTAVLSPLQNLQSQANKMGLEFQNVAQAFQQGKISAADYTAALNELNQKQMEANNGIQNGITAYLLAANAFRQLNVDATNALTNVGAIAKAVDAGQASWTQYVAALDALNKAQEAANGGLQELGTAVAMVDAAYTDAGVAVANAETHLQAVVVDMAEGKAGTVQYTEALNALQDAWIKVNNGIMDWNTALKQAQNSIDNARIAAENAQIALEAQYQVYLKTGQGLPQLIDLTNKYADAEERQNNGALSAADASAKIAADQAAANISLSNANTLLAQASQAYADGSITLGTYQKYLDAAKNAQDAVNGSTKTAASNSKAATDSLNGLTAAVHGFGQAEQDAITPGSNFATNLQYINGQWVKLGGVAADAANSTAQFATNVQYLGGKAVEMGGQAADATTNGLTPFATALQVINGQFVNIGSSAPGAAAGISAVGNAAAAAGKQAKAAADDMAQTLKAMDALSNSAAVTGFGGGPNGSESASASLSLAAGSTVTERAGGVNQTIIIGGASLNPQGKYAAASDAIDNLAASVTAVTDTTDALGQAFQDALAANQLETEAMQNYGTPAYQQLKASADAAVAAANAAIAAAGGQTSATNAQTVATQAATASTAVLADVVSSAGSTIQAAASGVAAITAAVAQYVAPVLGPGQGVGGTANVNALSSSLPTIGGGTAGGIGNGLKPATAFATNLIVNLNAGTVVGNNGMQQLSTMLSNEMVQQLSRLGIRLNRQ